MYPHPPFPLDLKPSNAPVPDLDAMVGVASGDALPTFADVADGSAAKKKKEMEAESARGSDTADRVRTAHDKASPDLDDLLAGLDDEVCLLFWLAL